MEYITDKLLECDVDIELDGVNFHLISDGRSVVFTFNKVSEALTFFKTLVRMTPSVDDKRKWLDEFLRSNGLTMYIQNRHFGVLGQNAHKIPARIAAVAGRFFSS